MKEIIKRKKILYILIALIIIIGIISICLFKLNFTVAYSEHTTIEVYLGKEYNLDDIKSIVKETLGKQEIIYQEIETFHDSVAITVKEASEDQINQLETKLKEKYEIEDNNEIMNINKVANLRGRDIIKPYIIPIIIATITILIYVGIRYLNLGLLKVVSTLIIRLLIAQALLLSIIAIVRIPIGEYTMPVVILLYMLVVVYTVSKYENELEKNEIKKDKK